MYEKAAYVDGFKKAGKLLTCCSTSHCYGTPPKHIASQLIA